MIQYRRWRYRQKPDNKCAALSFKITKNYRFQLQRIRTIIFIDQLMHLYIYYQITKTLCSLDSSYMFRHIACHHQGTLFSWLKSLVKNIRS
jgi:hypothetical protein